MAISIDWGTQVIFVPKSYTQFVSFGAFEIRQLDINEFRLDLKGLEASLEGMPHLKTHEHNTTIEVGGVTLARVVSIQNGYTVTFENGSYAVNLAGANSNIGDVVNLNQVQVRSANSAGLTFSEEINNQSYLGAKVFINTTGVGLSGTQFPRGTPTSPVDNYSDAKIIADTRRFDSFDLTGNIDFPIITDLRNTNWFASSPITASIISPLPPLDILGSTFTKLSLAGYYNGAASFDECILGRATLPFFGFNGQANDSGINGDIILDNGQLDNCILHNCFSTFAGNSKPTLNCSGITNTDVNIRAYTGGFSVESLKSGNNVSIDMLAGAIIIQPSCTGGNITIRGVSELIDNSSSGCTVTTTGLLNTANVNALSYVDSEVYIDAISGGTGTVFPIGTSQYPVNNLTDAILIAKKFGLRGFRVRGILIITNTNIDGYRFTGDEMTSTLVLVPDSGNSTNDSTFINIGLTGQLNGYVYGDKSFITHLTGVGSDVFPTVFHNTIIRNDNGGGVIEFRNDLIAPQDVHFFDCVSSSLNGEIGTLDLNGSGTPIGIRRFGGEIYLENYTGGQISTIEFNQGKLNIESSCTNGSLNLGGIYKLTNNGNLTIEENNNSITDNINFSGLTISGGTITGDTSAIAAAVWSELVNDNQNNGSFGKLLTDLINASNTIQHTNNLNTELLKDKPNNP